MERSINTRNYAIDYIKFYSIFAVVVIHTFPLDHLAGFYMLDALSRFAVPFFFMSSGYLFGRKITRSKSTETYFIKYLMKLLSIYALWFLFYCIYDISVLFMTHHGAEATDDILHYLDDFALLDLLYYGKGTSGYQLWFLPALVWSIFILYIFFRLKKIHLLILASLILNLAGLLGQSYTMFYKMPIPTRDALFFGLFYSTLGFFIASHKDKINKKRMAIKIYVLLFSCFAVLQVIEAYLLDRKLSGSHGEYFISTIFLTASLFIFVLQYNQHGKNLFVTKIGADSLGIYVIHVFFLNLVNLYLQTAGLKMSENFIWSLFETLFVFFISFYVYRMLQSAKKMAGI
ncbi:acyltransferase [Peribacillus sp. B-H-3]|jgi:surface polysaccharide O-acyltransferase-like enzyme|uniref:acyltransferase n=1 Tax=Peribacillus sp. B-H-3 TaxID=3400420 RepID=UPI003B01052E